MTEKQALRRQLLAKRRALPQRKEKDAAIFQHVAALPVWRQASQVLLYLSLPEEPDTLALARLALGQGKQVLAPVCSPGPGDMAFYPFADLGELRRGQWGIWEPVPQGLPSAPEPGTLCLTPGLAFDRTGARLGYGRGYYDRFLAGRGLYAVGLCYADLFVDWLPTTPLDERVALVVTEAGAYPCGQAAG